MWLLIVKVSCLSPRSCIVACHLRNGVCTPMWEMIWVLGKMRSCLSFRVLLDLRGPMQGISFKVIDSFIDSCVNLGNMNCIILFEPEKVIEGFLLSARVYLVSLYLHHYHLEVRDPL